MQIILHDLPGSAAVSDQIVSPAVHGCAALADRFRFRSVEPIMTTEALPKPDRSALVVSVHLRLLAEAADDALDRQAANAVFVARAAELIQANRGLPWSKSRWS